MPSIRGAQRELPARLSIFVVVLICYLIALSMPSAWAQGTGDIVGTVTDSSKAVVRGAVVTVRNLDTNLTRVQETDVSGQYSFALLPIGYYSVTVELTSFKTFTNPRLLLGTGDRARVDAELQVGAAGETIEVTGEATGALQTDSATVGGLMTARSVQDLPVSARNFVRLVQLAPGMNESTQIAGVGGTRVDDRRETSAVSANGQSDAMNNFLLDGMDNNDRNVGTIIVKPSIDAIEEVKVDTSLYSADLGRAGGAVVNMITKAGTNNYHGTLFEFLRNDALDAKDFFNVPQEGNPLAGKQTPLRQNQFGGSIGGPIRKDKTFFFADYEGFRKVRGFTVSPTIPTSCQLGTEECNGIKQLGNFSDISAKIYDPITHQPFPNNVIPLDRISKSGANYAQLYPTLPRSACGDTCRYVYGPKETQSANTADARIDHQFNTNNTLFFRYSYNHTVTNAPGLLPPATAAGVEVPVPSPLFFLAYFPGNFDQGSQAGALSYTRTFSPTLLLQASMQVSRYIIDADSHNADQPLQTIFGGPAGINTATRGTNGLALTRFLNGGYSDMGDGFAMPVVQTDTNYQYSGTFNWVKGTHAVKFGGSVLRRNWSTFQVLFKGNLMFSSIQTNSNGTGGGTGGNSFASLLTGYYQMFIRNMTLASPMFRNTEVGAFVQDNWRIRPWLTLNLGLRYDVITPTTAKRSNIANFDPTDPDTLAGGRILVAGQDGVSESLNITTKWKNFQPRTGFAATLRKGMVLRGGFGMSIWPGALYSPAKFSNAPFTSTFTLIQTPGTPTHNLDGSVPPPDPGPTCLVAACGAPAGSNFSIGNGMETDYNNTVVYMFNLMLEREFANNVLTVGYVGQMGRNLPRIIPNANTNPPPLDSGGCGQTTTVTFPSPCQPYHQWIPMVNSIQLLQQRAKSNYSALQLIFQRRLQAGLTLSSNYTWGKSLADTGGSGGSCGGCNQVVNDFSRDYGPNDYNVTHRFSFTSNYSLPFGSSMSGFAGQLLKGWETNAVVSYSTGQPFTVLNSRAQQNSIGITSDRPDALPQGKIERTIDQWFDTTAFRAQPFGTAGDLGRNTLTGPSYFRMDLSVFKNFVIHEDVRLQFRVEMFNFTNTPSFGLPGSTISSFDANGVPTRGGNFGRITSMSRMYTPRDIQFALKLIF